MLAVTEYLDRLTKTWWECDEASPPFGVAYAPREQGVREAQLARFLDELLREARRPPRTAAERDALQERLLAGTAPLIKLALGLEDRHVDALGLSDFGAAATAFARAARRFDPAVSIADIYQAGRNAVTANFLQRLLGLPVQSTPAVFAYSMLYPYSDNILDDPALPGAAKHAFNGRFRRRLSGEPVGPGSPAEEKVWALIAMIESQYARAAFPQVYASLLAIHAAQHKSMRLLRPGASPYEADVLGISFEKGGTSVLADGYLVAGTLAGPQAEFLFGLGALLQLGDDLEDMAADRQAGLMTVFAQTAGRWPLDRLTTRALHFGRRMLARMSDFAAPGTELLWEFVDRSAMQPIYQSAGQASRFYSRDYLRALEAHSSFRFAFVRDQHRKLGRRREVLGRFLEAFLGADEASGLALAAARAIPDLS